MSNKGILLIKSLLSTLGFMYLSSLGVSNIFVLIIFYILYLIYSKTNLDKSIYTKLCATIFGIFGVLFMFQVNVYEEQIGGLPSSLRDLKLLLVFLSVYFFVEVLLSLLYRKLDKHNVKETKNTISPNKFFIICFAVLVIVYLPIWIFEYPSNLNPDNISQINQILSGNFVNHHPFAHTMWLKLLMSFGNDLNTRVGIAALLQLVINALTFAFVSKTIYKKTNNIYFGLMSLAFFSLLSFHAFFSITLIKDTTHATTTCLLLITLIEYFDCSNKKKENLLSCLIVILSIGFCLFRTNGYFAYVLMVFVVIIYSLFKKSYKLLIILIISFMSATIIKGPIYTNLDIQKASYVENLSIPVQQIGFLKYRNAEFTDIEDELINNIVNADEVGEKYEFFLSDPIKNAINDFGNVSYLEENKIEYLKLWIKVGLRYPVSYIRAWVDQTSTFYSPKYYGTSLFWGMSNSDLNVERSPLMDGGEFSDKLYNLAYKQHNIPVLGWFHYPAISTWVLCIALFYNLRNNRFKSAFLFVPAVGIFLTLLISCPYNICFRYYYAVVCSVPLLLMQTIRKADY